MEAPRAIMGLVSFESSSQSSGYYPSNGPGSDMALVQLNDSVTERLLEKKEMRALNDTLAAFVNNSPFLSSQITEIQASLTIQRKKWEEDSSKINEVIDVKFKRLAEELQRTREENSKLEFELRKERKEHSVTKEELHIARDYHTEDLERINKLTLEVCDLQNEVTKAKREKETLAIELERDKTRLRTVEEEISILKREVTSEKECSIEAEHRAEKLGDELDILKHVQEKKIMNLLAIAYRDTTVEIRKRWSHELSQAIRDIDDQYNVSLQKYYAELEERCKQKERQCEIGISRSKELVTKYKEESKRLHKTLEDYKSSIKDWEFKNTHLDIKCKELEAKLGHVEHTHQKAIEQFDIKVKEWTTRCEFLEKKQLELTDIKLSLEVEIAQYRTLLQKLQSAGLITPAKPDKPGTGSTWDVVHDQGKVQVSTTVTRTAKGRVIIDEVQDDGKYVLIEHTASSGLEEDQSLAGWKLKQTVDDKKKIKFTFPDRFDLKSGGTVKVWSYAFRSERERGDLVLGENENWGQGTKVVTTLYDENKKKRSTLSKDKKQATQLGPAVYLP